MERVLITEKKLMTLQNKRKFSKRTEKVLTYFILLITSGLVLYPIFLIFISSLKTSTEFMGNPIGLPSDITFENYKMAWEKANFGQFAINSVIVTGVSVLGIVLLGAMAAYSFRRKFRGHQLFFNFFLLGLMIPTQATIITLFIFLKQIHLLNSLTGLIFYYMAHFLPLSIFIFAGFFRTIPKELEEAAMLDGCSQFMTFWKVILPISKPVISTVVILTGMAVWNDFLMPLILIMDKEKYTLGVGLLRLKGEFSVNWPNFFAAMSMLITPIIILFLFLQKHFINGLTSGSVKG